MVRALLFGGGGVTHGEDPMLEDFLITLLPASPLVGYIGFANDDDPVRLERMIKRFQAWSSCFTLTTDRFSKRCRALGCSTQRNIC